MADYGQNMMNPGNANMQPCPVPTQDPNIRATNTEQAVQLANYGASEIEAKCGGCMYFDISKRMKGCMDEKDSSVGYCHRWQFQCQKKNTCDAYDIGGPIKTDKESRAMQAERGEDAINEGPHIPKEEIMSSISPVQEQQLPAEQMSPQDYVAAARKGGQISSIIKKKRLGGIPKANKGTGITYDEAWSTNKDGIQDKYETQGDFEAYAEDWWAQQKGDGTPTDENTPPEANTDKKLTCIKCVDGAIEPVLPSAGEELSVCPEGSFDASVVKDPCNIEDRHKKEDVKKEEKDFSGKVKKQGDPAWPSPDPYHLPFLDDTNLGKAVGWMHGAATDWGLIGNDKKDEEENKTEAAKLEDKAADDGRITCQKCEGGMPISNLFKDKCPEGWVPASDTDPCDGADPNAEKKDSEEDSTQESSFDEAFRTARDAGQDVFTWKGKSYHTMTREEVDAQNTLDTLKAGIADPQSQSEIDIQNEREKIMSGDDKWWEEEQKFGGSHPLDVFLGRADAGTETKDEEYWYNIYKQNIGQSTPISFEEWKGKMDFNTDNVSNPNVTPTDNSQVDLNVPQEPNNTDFGIMGEDADGDGIPNSIDSDFAGTTTPIGPENQSTNTTTPPVPDPNTPPAVITACQKCENGAPMNIAPVDGKCPEGSEPEDLNSNPCDKEEDVQDVTKKEEKKEDNPCPPTYKWDEESKTCKPGGNIFRPITKGAKTLAAIKRSSNEKKDEIKRESVTTKSDVVFADAIGDDYQGDTNINTGKKQRQNVYSRSGAYGTEIDNFMFDKGGEANIDMETYKKLIKAGAQLDIID